MYAGISAFLTDREKKRNYLILIPMIFLSVDKINYQIKKEE